MNTVIIIMTIAIAGLICVIFDLFRKYRLQCEIADFFQRESDHYKNIAKKQRKALKQSIESIPRKRTIDNLLIYERSDFERN